MTERVEQPQRWCPICCVTEDSWPCECERGNIDLVESGPRSIADVVVSQRIADAAALDHLAHELDASNPSELESRITRLRTIQKEVLGAARMIGNDGSDDFICKRHCSTEELAHLDAAHAYLTRAGYQIHALCNLLDERPTSDVRTRKQGPPSRTRIITALEEDDLGEIAKLIDLLRHHGKTYRETVSLFGMEEPEYEALLQRIDDEEAHR